MELELLTGILSTLHRAIFYLLVRVIPSPILALAMPTVFFAYMTTLYLSTPKTTDEKQDPIRTILFSLPTTSARLRKLNLGINLILLLMTLEFIATPFIDTAESVSFSRIGAVSSDSVKISIRAPQPNVTTHLLYREVKDVEPENAWRNGPALAFSNATDFVHTVRLAGLWPNTSYEYALADANRSLTSGPFAFRTFPDSRLSTGSHFRFVASSCMTPNFPYVPFHGRTIKGFDLLARYLFPETAPLDLPVQFMLFLGDFIYSDVPVYIGDTKEAYRRLYRRNYQSKSFRKVYERLPIIHAADDHEFTNNYAGLGNDSMPPFPSASDAWKIYNADANPDSLADHYYFNFRYGDAAFFVLDTRRYRTPATDDEPTATMLGETQLAALHSWLAHVNSTASFKFIISSVPFVGLWTHDPHDSWAGFPAEKAQLLEAFHSVPNVVIISGDRHEFASIEFNAPPDVPGGHTVREFSTSPLSMFDIPFYRTLRPASDETVPQNRSELVVTEEGPIYVNTTIQVPKERSIKYLARGNYKWSAFEVDTRDLSRPTLRIELSIDGKIRYQVREEYRGAPVKLQSSNALGVFVTTGIKDVFNRIGINPSRWF
ncbi:PhoD-like phosphatase-domain-containing protein [Roridomyces roridus]|uniref:PhoD-like phosphatase-domain-containing protein n=1 Tax=Roridomyces roridus TaxID=1738132 RepID=A0AAD7BW91_9AGAR|nr:PhoD-like phosphatase-domain-containing protein [Roridomyces roridus]